MNRPYAFVFDIDGTLAGVTEERKAILRRHDVHAHHCMAIHSDAALREFMADPFLREAPLLNNEAVSLCRIAPKLEVPRVYLTGRLEEHQQATHEWLRYHFQWEIPTGIMRKSCQRDWPANRYKKFGLYNIKLALGVDRIIFFDDDPEVCELARTIPFVQVIQIEEQSR